MKIEFDPVADALYIQLTDKKFDRCKEIDEDTILDLDKDGNVIGIEMLSISKRVPIEQLSNINVHIPAEKHLSA